VGEKEGVKGEGGGLTPHHSLLVRPKRKNKTALPEVNNGEGTGPPWKGKGEVQGQQPSLKKTGGDKKEQKLIALVRVIDGQHCHDHKNSG